MENNEDMKDQLCHIFSYGVSTLCLTCKRIISDATSPNSRQKRVLNHLESSDHKEGMRTLFKMCIPDPVCNIDDERYLDIVTKSIFDISVLLGEESSYICQRDDQLVCLMCKLPISKITHLFAQIKVKITQHLESTVHAKNIKEVCWYYRLYSKKDYLLFYKSIWHCSVCNETSKCKETELLQSAVRHMESNAHEARQHFKTIEGEKAAGIIQGSGNNGLKYYDNVENFEVKRTLSFIKSEVVSENLNYSDKVECAKQLEPNVQLHSKVRMDGSVQKQEMNISLGRLDAQDVMCSHKCLDRNKVFNKCIKCVRRILKGMCSSEDYLYLGVKYNKFLCRLCKNNLSSTSNLNTFVKSYVSHCESQDHRKNLEKLREIGKRAKKKRKRKRNRDTPGMLEEKENLECINSEVVHDAMEYTAKIECEKHIKLHVQSHSQDGMENLQTKCKNNHEVQYTFYAMGHALPGLSSVTSMTLNAGSIQKQEMNEVSNSISCNFQVAQDVVCLHKCLDEDKVFNKCIRCLRGILRKTYHIEGDRFKVENNECLCGLCKKVISASNVKSLFNSLVQHFQSKTHQKRLKVLKEKREARKRKNYLKRKNELRKKRKMKSKRKSGKIK